MRKLLNTLYVTTQGAWLARDGETLAVRVEKETRLRVPIHTLGSVICFGNVSMSPFAMDLCASNGVAAAFLTEHGRFLARVQGPVAGNVLLRREQYRRADDPAGSADIARAVVIGKVANGRSVLLRGARERDGDERSEAMQRAAARLAQVLAGLDHAESVDEIRGLEGDGARAYFGAFDHLIEVSKDDFFFRERSRRPPVDNVNALLSFLYTLLVHDVGAALEAVGLDPAVGFLHRDRPGRPGLALDLMEELRPLLGDRLALTLINRQQVRADGFQKTESGAVTMDDATRKTVLVAYQNRKQEELLHPFLEEKIAVGMIAHVQAMLLARHLRGDLDGYPPFLWK
ncbi:MAG: type I-C CRISPR-associated endonuclease Cas1c [Bryobacteraceae bacterium]